MSKIQIVAAVADENFVTLYKTDGKTLIISADDYRIIEIQEKVLPIVAKGQVAELDISEYKTFKTFTEKSGGYVTFFKVGDRHVKGTFVPEEGETLTAEEVKILCEPIESVNELAHDETVVAVVEDTVIPKAEKLVPLLDNANKHSTKGMENFMKRISGVIQERGHSIEDLLKFLEKADLPIADDGSVIAYKNLINRQADSEGVFVDIHSKRVLQKVGSFVHMDQGKVDPSRNNDCSHGLHIASRSYLSGFSGDVTVICKIAPEDFIAVPQYSPNKVRVSGYHIVALVPKGGVSLLMSNKPMTDDEASSMLLADIIKGNHIGITENVFIGGPKGSDLKITPVEGTKKKTVEPSGKKAKALDGDKKDKLDEKISPKEIRKTVNKATEDAKAKALRLLTEGKMSKAAIAREIGTSTRTLGRWVDAAKAAETAPFAGATDQQTMAFDLLKQGKTKAEAARLAGTSPRTLGRWCDKFGIKT